MLKAFVASAFCFAISCAYAGTTEWFSAAQDGDIGALEANLGTGSVAVDRPDQYGRTALLVATRYGQGEAVKWLLQHGADPNKREVGESPSIPMPDIKGRKSWYSNEDRTPLMHALIQRQTAIANLLLDAGANPLAEDRSGTHMLYFACDAGVAKRLIDAGLDPRRPRSKKNPYEGLFSGPPLPLTSAVKCEDSELVRLYLEAGADPNARAGPNENSLHYALAAKAPIEVVRVLVDGGADVNAMADRRVTPLMHAAECPDPEILRFLLERGAKPDVMTDYGQTAMNWVRGSNQDEKRRILQDALAAATASDIKSQ